MDTTTTTAQEATVTTIALQPADANAKTYGIVLKSETYHDVTGRGVHNRSFPHQVDVWENRNGKDPHGQATDEPYTVLLKARSVAIVAHPAMRDTTPQGKTLAIGERVQLTVHGFVIGTYEVTARMMRDPELVKVA